MRRAVISIILIVSLLSVFSTSVDVPLSISSSTGFDSKVMDSKLLSEMTSSGSNVPIEQSVNRMFPDQVLTISNSFSFPDNHEASIDLSSYQIPGWTLNKVIIDTQNITAIAEKEIVGNSSSPTTTNEFAIDEYSSDNYYSQLAQGFYNMSHDGQLQNISFLYMSPSYTPADQNYTYFDLRSDYQDGSTNMVTSVQLEDVFFTQTWANITETVILNADSVYYAVLNGSLLVEHLSSYPNIRWFYENTAGSFLTRRYSTEYGAFGASDLPYEAILNYTYIPWNQTANSALVYSDPGTINTNLNGSSASGSAWIASSANNITSLNIATNQSVNVFYNLTLCYTNDNVGNTVWGATTSAAPIGWNVTTDLIYPAVSNVVARVMNITTVPLDWAATGLYIGSTPGGSYSKTGSNVTCSGLSDGTWTLTSTAPNYAVGLALSDSSDSSPISYKVRNNVTMDIDVTIEDSDTNPMDGGTTNLSIIQSSSIIFSPAEIPASSGAAGFQWDISATTTGNATHSVELYWKSAGRLEAGYITQEVFVFHSTTLVADDYGITNFTESSFDIGVDFDSIYPAVGLDDSPADVTFSFAGVYVNQTMNNPSGGRWIYSVDTTGVSSGRYDLTVYAEGFALENQSLIITVDLTVETLALNWSWSNTNNITYLDSTNLTVTYRDSTNNRISGAWVNVTFDAQTYNLTWDASSEVYWIELYGLNFTTVPGTTNLTVNAWKAGYTSQATSNIQIIVTVEIADVALVVNWNPVDRNITYIETITISVSYTFNTIPIDDSWDGVTVRATFSGHPPVDLIYYGGSGLWEITLNGSDYLGITTVTIRASATGYNQLQDVQDLLVTDDIPTLTNSWTDSAASTDYDTNILLQITVRDSSGAFINGATLTANVFATDFPMTPDGDGVYSILIDPQETRGIHVVNVTIAETGYAVTSTFLNLTVRATTSIDFVDYISSEHEQWNLNITVTYNDTIYNIPIIGAIVTVTIDGEEYALTYDNDTEFYVREILLDFNPGMYTINVVANAPFCNEAINSSTLTIQAKDHVYLSLTTEGDPSAEGQILSIIATLTYNESGVGVPNENIHFIVTIHYSNGTIELRDDATQFDTTNTVGVATWGLEIPAGIIESISIEAEYLGSRVIWDTSLTYEVAVGANPLIAVLSFFIMDDVGRLLTLSIILLGVVATAYNKKVKPKKRAARASLENQLQMFRDLETLRHYMAVYLDRGTCVFYHPFTDERIQPDLISGFIAAITSVYGEIKGDGVRGTLEEIQYHGLRLNSYSGEFVIGILILEGEMTPLLKDRLQFFVELFENQYDNELTDWTGLIDCFDPEWVVSTLSSAFNYSWLLAHKFGPTQKVTKSDARVLDYISAVRDDRSEFYFRDLLTPLAEMLDISEAAVLDRLLALQDRGIIVPVSIQTILQRQGMGLANGEIGADSIPLELPEKEETPVDEVETPEEETVVEAVEEPEPAEDESDIADDFVKEVESLMEEEPEETKKEADPMDEFVQDVESLLTKEKEEDE